MSNTHDVLGEADVSSGATVVATQASPPVGATVAQVASSASAVTLQAANASRQGLHIYNDSTATLYVKFGSAAATNSYTVQVASQSLYEMPSPYYRGIVTGIWSAANGNAYITEVA